MSLILATRLFLYLQLVLGTLQSPGLYNGVSAILHTHRTLAFIIPVVAFLAFRPSKAVPGGAVKLLARFGPTISLLLGLINWVGFKMLAVMPADAYLIVMVIHMLIGIAVVAFVEIAAGKERRALAAAQADAATAS